MKQKTFFRALLALCMAALLTAPAFAAQFTIRPVSGKENTYTTEVPQNVNLLVAAYGANGQMQSILIPHGAQAGTEKTRVEFLLPAGAKIKAFFLTEAFTPLEVQEKEDWSTSPYQPTKPGGNYELPEDKL